MHRFFVPSLQIKPDQIEILGKDVNHIKNVLRLSANDKIELFDEKGIAYHVAIKTISHDKITCSIINSAPKGSELPIKVTLAQCLPKGNKGKKMDFIIQKATELGAHAIIPLTSDRTVVKLEQGKDRWQNIAKEAAQQSGRTMVPKVQELLSFDQLLSEFKSYDLVLIPWESEQKNTLKKILCSIPHALSPKVLIIIGPEGGFSSDEIASAKNAGALPVTLGKRILRTETVALCVLSMIIYEFEL